MKTDPLKNGRVVFRRKSRFWADSIKAEKLKELGRLAKLQISEMFEMVRSSQEKFDCVPNKFVNTVTEEKAGKVKEQIRRETKRIRIWDFDLFCFF